jgi:hypothetical protein
MRHLAQKVRKLLAVADAVFTIAGIVGLVISRFDPSRPLFWAGIAVAILGLLGAFMLRRISKGRRQELMLQIDPKEWTVEGDDAGPTDAWLTITEDRHERGPDVSVRVQQVALKHWDLAEPEIGDGNITIRYAHNNFPDDPRIPLRVYISGRG